MILTVLKLHSPKGSCNFENCQNHSYLLITNCTRGRAISYILMRRLSPIKNRIGLNQSAKNYGLIRDFLNKIRALIKHISPETLKRGLKLSHT